MQQRYRFAGDAFTAAGETQLLGSGGFHVDVTIIAQAPKMLPHIPQMRIFIAEDLGCHMDDVNVKATTTEKLGFTGRGEGIACEAVALLRKAEK